MVEKIKKLIAEGKYSPASVLLSNSTDKLTDSEFDFFNRKIKENFPKKRGRESDLPPSSCGKRVSGHMFFGHGHN